MKLEEVADYLIKILLEKEFIVHRYNAYSTNSIYLKLDYGACNSIRISDHNGYEHLSYKYNVIKNCTNPGWKKDYKGQWRFTCSTNKLQLNILIKIILEDRQYKKCFNDYNKVINSYKQNIELDKGFWKDVWEVTNEYI